MTKRHFIAIAATFKRELELMTDTDSSHTAAEYAAVCAIARHLATTFADVNPRFDRARFLRACGVES